MDEKPNMALKFVLARDPTGDDFEKLMKKCDAKAKGKNPELIRATIHGPTIVIRVRYARNKKGDNWRPWKIELTDVDDEHLSQYNLDRMYKVILGHCSKLTDVSMLSNVYRVRIDTCEQISDVSALSGATVVDIRRCPKITDVSTLGNVKYLRLYNCQGITDVSALGRVKNLDLSFCNGITDTSALTGIPRLELTGCANLPDASMMRAEVRRVHRGGCGHERCALVGQHTNEPRKRQKTKK